MCLQLSCILRRISMHGLFIGKTLEITDIFEIFKIPSTNKPCNRIFAHGALLPTTFGKGVYHPLSKLHVDLSADRFVHHRRKIFSSSPRHRFSAHQFGDRLGSTHFFWCFFPRELLIWIIMYRKSISMTTSLYYVEKFEN